MTRFVIYLCLVLAVVAAEPKTERNSQFNERVIGGTAIEISSVPYQVTLLYRNGHVCGGSIISSKHILTAAHCLPIGTARDYSVRMGSNYHEYYGETLRGAKITKHPKFNYQTADYDAAILELSESIKSNSKGKVIPLADREPKPGESVLVSGWGATKAGGSASTTLQSISFSAMDKNYCKFIYSKTTRVTDNMFCTAPKSENNRTGQGDSGGPAVVNGKQAGIVSWGAKNGPGVYTSIPKIKSWIEQTTK